MKPLSLTGNAVKVLESRYLLHGEGFQETPAQLFERVAGGIAAAELKWGGPKDVERYKQEFEDIMSSLLFLPNSPTLMNAGTPLNQLSACFVLPVDDSLNDIFTSVKNAAIIQQSGGGTGFNFSHLRPKGAPLSVTNGTASGPVSFMKVFNATTEHIKHGGKRRGANMGILNINHPDIEEFIVSKKEKDVLNNFNISVGITDDFMIAVESGADWKLLDPKTRDVVKIIKAKTLWNKIVENAWQSGDPGIIFFDAINNSNPLPGMGNIETTNPCGEVPLLPYEPCNLGSINIGKFVKQVNQGFQLDWSKLEEVIKIAIRFLDNIVEINNYPIPEIKSMALGNRKIGLGLMGWADLLVQLEMAYESDEAIQLAEELMQFINEKSMEASVELAEVRGEFPNWKKSIYYPDSKIRNATRTSIAPTGTISIIAGASSSIEPFFALAFQRQHVLNEENLFSINKTFVDYLVRHGLYSDHILEQVTLDGVATHISELSPEVKNLFKTALEIAPSWHLKHQIAFQKYTDNAVSKTINLPEEATISDVDAIYKSAWQQRAKGITVFRYNSKGKQVMHQGIKYSNAVCKICIE